MQAYVYKSLRKADTYVYLAARDDFARLPEPLRAQLGALQFVLEVALTPGAQARPGGCRGSAREPGPARFPPAVPADRATIR